MSSKTFVVSVSLFTAMAAITALSAQTLEQSISGVTRFYSDDPLWRDDDTRTIAEPAEHDLSKSYEFIANTFGETARSFGPALNVNTLGEVPIPAGSRIVSASTT